MGVASHLHIRVEEYDARIRTFVPGYEAMVEAAAAALAALESPPAHLVDLGTGSGALVARCLDRWPAARFTAIDEDAGMLDLARQRLGARAAQGSLVHASFVDAALPACDAIVASLALHHIRSAEAKRAMYARCREAVRPGGLVVTADCMPSSDARLASLDREAWRAHLQRTYSREEADGFLAAWAEEDVYFTLFEELAMLRDAGFAPDIVWRAGAMGVIAAR